MTALVLILAIAALALVVLIVTGGGMADRPVSPPQAVLPPGQLNIRTATRADVASIVEIGSQPANMAANGWDSETVTTQRQSLETCNDETLELYFVGELSSGQVATVGSFNHKPGTTEHSIGLQVHTACQGSGLGTEMMRVLIMSCQASIDGPVWVGTATTNAAMQRMMERLGYSPEPGVEPYEAPNGEVFDSLWYKVGRSTRPPRMS